LPSRNQPVAIHNTRQLALEICQQLVLHGLSLDDLLAQHLPRLPNDRDRGFCSELCYGFCRYYYLLRNELGKRLKKPLKARDQDIEILLLLGLYQIRFMRVENHAAVNESVKLLQKRRKTWAKGLVNALLRGYIRDLSEQKLGRLETDEQVQTYPPWMRQQIEQDWGESAFDILQVGNQRAPMTLRVDVSKLERSDYLQRLSQADITARPHEWVATAVVLDNPCAVESLPGFDAGLVSVQDASAQLAASLLEVLPTMHVLDACAAPGGKTLHILQSAQPLEVTALDKDAARLQRVAENLQRGRVQAHSIAADAADVESWFDGRAFDRILLDAPCSASGIIRRHPDIRLLRQSADIVTLVEQQRRLLEALWPLVKKGGRLLYSTCSLFKVENERQLSRFVEARDNAAEIQLNTVQWGVARPVGRQVLPCPDMDGFYYGLLQKTADD